MTTNSKVTNWKQRLLPADYQQLRDTFDVFDQDGSGTIDPVQINKIFEEMGTDGRNPLVVQIIKKIMDLNKPINFDQFVDIVGSLIGETSTKDGARRVFKIIDENEDGVVDFQELRKWLKQVKEYVNDDEILEMLHSTNVNHKTSTNEGVTFEEFYNIVIKYNK